MTSLRQMIGLPVVWQDTTLGFVERAVLNDEARRLRGVVIRRGLGNARWIPSRMILTVGEKCVLVCGETLRLPKQAELTLTRAYLTTGECVGLVTDALLDGATMRVSALEVSNGPLYWLMGKRAYATGYRVRPEEQAAGADAAKCEIVAPRLRTWAEVSGAKGKGEHT